MNEPDLERMLIETLCVIESVNLMELLPIEVATWYQSKRLEEEAAGELNECRINHLPEPIE